MIEVELRHSFVDKARDPSPIDIHFAAPSTGVTVLFGPSGSGKSTTIAALAGLLRPNEGRLALDGDVLCDTAQGRFIAPERRRIGVVFQDAYLFPHMSVRANLMYGASRAPPGPIEFAEVVEILGLGSLLRRRPHTLSGGERQRVAIGRALLAQPRLLLMDEPLASLDPARRAAIMPFLVATRRRLRSPIVYVTHQIDELATLGDTLVMLERGRVTATGPLATMSARGDLGLALIDSAGAVLEGTVSRHDAERGLTELRLGVDGRLVVSTLAGPPGSPVRVRVPAADIVLATDAIGRTSAQNQLSGTVRAIHITQHRDAMVELDVVGGFSLLARITLDAAQRLGLERGSTVAALVKSTGIRVLDA